MYENVLHNEDTEELEGKLIELENKISEHTEVSNLDEKENSFSNFFL